MPWMSVRQWLHTLKRQREDLGEEISSGWWRYAALPAAGLLSAQVFFGIYWSHEPQLFDVRANADAAAAAISQPVTTGTTTVAALEQIVNVLLNKRGGYLANDVLPPGLPLDNIPAWEYGALTQVRDMAKALREAFSRSQSQSRADGDLVAAESRFNFDHKSWVLPSSESEYREANRSLHSYLVRISQPGHPDAQFYARSDNLRYWLGTVETRLGDLSQRLSASVGQRRLNVDLANDPHASQSTRGQPEMMLKTPWLQVDDVFYEARGSTWALIELLRAVEIDFADVLKNKNADVSLQQIIRELEATQQPIDSPMILNGSGMGILANHSLVMASYISRAHAGIIDLRDLLANG